jgi:hypothetical protein
LNRKLHKALERLVAGNTDTAVEQLREFILQVEGLVEEGKLSEKDGEELSRKASSLIDRLRKRDPAEAAPRATPTHRE